MTKCVYSHLWILLFSCVCLTASQSDQDTSNVTVSPVPIHDQCKSFYLQYMEHSTALIDCELLYSAPFRLCTNCIQEYTITKRTFQILNEEASMEKCRELYLRADRVQVIPTVQRNIDKLWEDAQCGECTQDVVIDPQTDTVNYSIPESVATFLAYHHNLTQCLATHDDPPQDDLDDLDDLDTDNTSSSTCRLCSQDYHALNQHFIHMSADATEGPCMDIVDMMNNTRHTWSVSLKCSHRSGDQLPIILVTLLVSITPIAFYGVVRITGKEDKKKLLRQKRLITNLGQDSVSISSSTYFAAGDSLDVTNRLRPIT